MLAIGSPEAMKTNNHKNLAADSIDGAESQTLRVALRQGAGWAETHAPHRSYSAALPAYAQIALFFSS
ncbi:hypothetical protein DICVIV_09384 [Dictyocaulus viviparus]|uniref:Uncharacterized protein n=1 Tax=Dictyocaulus viviparus TaxID=29172 RepID=A0A0D8XLG2_DICVI|nr:hypothetical protein DICVIV_09384 [Dictyocaulus viviparus]